jgi:GNAT superfamily N-acetyltransferase
MAFRREMYIYVEGGRIDGTVSLKGDTIFAFFIAPDRQHLGIGSKLLSFVEEKVRAAGIRRIRVGASITAKGFYTRHGFRTVRRESDGSFGDVFYMEKAV